MMGGHRGGPMGMMQQEALKPKNVSETLRRFGVYFKPFWPALLLVAVLVVISTWTQVTGPQLLGQAVDCYLSPAQAAGGLGGLSGVPAQSSQTTQAASSCTYDPSASPTMSNDAKFAGLGSIVLKLIGLYLLGSVATGLTFYLMGWAGQHVLKSMRVAVFKHLHRLSLGYYAENEAGNLMSRITNDSDTIQQAISFALVNVVSGVLLLVWIAYNMLTASVPFALISLAMAPFMWIATKWFSAQARKAFRKTRSSIGDVNAELQQSIAGVREVQAFSREQENIDNFRNVNAANRDANIRAVAFTSALAPTLEALGYAGMALVATVGGFLVLHDTPLFGATVSLGLVITFIAYVQRFNQPIQQIAVLWTNIQSAIAGGERIFGLLDVVPDVQDKPDARPMPQIQGTVEFAETHAEYEKGVPVLCGVNFKAEPGQMIAVVGPTGAGKTTIINLAAALL